MTLPKNIDELLEQAYGNYRDSMAHNQTSFEDAVKNLILNLPRYDWDNAPKEATDADTIWIDKDMLSIRRTHGESRPIPPKQKWFPKENEAYLWRWDHDHPWRVDRYTKDRHPFEKWEIIPYDLEKLLRVTE